jgi:L-lactate dehydrogenase
VVDVRSGDYSDLKGAALAVITAGVNEKTGGATDRNDPAGRLRLLDTNVGVYADIISKLKTIEPRVLALVVTDPPDPLTDATRLMGHDKVLSAGTYLDSLRFRFHVARRLGVSASSVVAHVLGEHGTSEALPLADRRRLTRALRPRECAVGRHEPRQHGRNELGGLESFSRRLTREGLGVGDEIAMQRRRQLDRHLYRLVVFDRAELQLCHDRLFNLGRARARGHG